jgi:OOP family OmpA-OmpF porin
MNRPFWGATIAGLAAAAWIAPAAAVHTEGYEVPYFGLDAGLLVTDAARDADDGLGFQLKLGVPMRAATSAIELRFYDAGYDRADGKQNFQTGLFVDYVRDFGPLGDPQTFLGGLKPFASLGAGFVQEDVNADKHLHLGFAIGGGILAPLGWNGWAVRLDGRLQPQVNDESVAGEDYLLDYVVNLGVQMPMTWFYDRPAKAVPEQDCPLAVVHPETGRRDCVTDSDGDGVHDAADQCPGTPEGSAVDREGCIKKVRVVADADQDGVPDDDDDCPGTQRGLKVDDDGCVVAQKTAVQGVTFEMNSAKLTSEGRATLDGIAETLRSQEGLKAEIAGHTDAIGSESFNTMLSQQRADAVRAYLMEKGVDGARLTAVGYGELEPVASNDTDEGRQANRRVEFRIED